MLSILSFWVVIQILGWVTYPITFRLFRWLPDRGLIFNKTLGLLLVSYLLWFGASLGIMGNNLGGILAALLLVAAVSTWLALKGRERDGEASGAALQRFLGEKRQLIWLVEALFLAAFLAWAALRAYADFKIQPAGGEKFMEIAFLNAILESPQFPPNDPWLSGFAISYYYFGYVMMSVMTRLAGALPGVAFDLYDALLFALTVTGAFGVLYNLVPAAKKAALDARRVLTGLLASLFVAVMGNLEGFLEALYAWGKLPAGFWQWLDIPSLVENGVISGRFYPEGGGWYWWWRASRVIQDRDMSYQPIGNSPITEFPFFSFLLGDNHPHVLALPFVLLAAALALNLLRALADDTMQPADDGQRWWNPAAHVFGGDIALFALYAVCLGALIFLNTWDYPVYLGLTLLAFLAGRYARTHQAGRPLWGGAAALGLGLGAVGLAAYGLFLLSFDSQAGGVLPYVYPPTRFVHFFIIFGPFLVILSIFLIAATLRAARRWGADYWRDIARAWAAIAGLVLGAFFLLLSLAAAILSLAPQVEFLREAFQPLALAVQQYMGALGVGELWLRVATARALEPELFLLLTAILALAGVGALWRARRLEGSAPLVRPETTFALMMAGLGAGLALVVEFVYLRDVFGVRMNTVFKFYFQVWVLFALSSAYAVWWLQNRLGRTARLLLALTVLPLVAAGLVYPLLAYPDRAADFKSANLDGSSSIAWQYPDDWAAIEWLRANADRSQGAPVILEAVRPDLGFAYAYEGRISAFTGFPAVLGWSGHEGQWRGSYDEQSERLADIAAIYTTRDPDEALNLMRKWQVRYVIFGQPEWNYIIGLCANPSSVCDADAAARKFDQILTPVFSQGTTTIFQTP